LSFKYALSNAIALPSLVIIHSTALDTTKKALRITGQLEGKKQNDLLAYTIAG